MMSMVKNDIVPIARRVWEEVGRDQVEVLAGGVAFFGMLSLFPAIAAVVLVYGLFANPAELEGQLTWIAQSLVPLARDVLQDSLRLAGTARTTLSLGATSALLLAIYGASRATNAILLSVQTASGDKEMRGFLAQLRLNLVFTTTALVSLGLALIPLAATPGILLRLGVSDAMVNFLLWLRWPFLWLGFYCGVVFLYQWAPTRKVRASQGRVWPGALAATIAWTLVSFGFSFYAARLGGYGGTYGPAAAIAVFMTWLFLTAFIVIAGAELNSELWRIRLETKDAPSHPASSLASQPSSARMSDDSDAASQERAMAIERPTDPTEIQREQ